VLGIQFCKWNDCSTHEARRLVRTMAFQIASRHPDYRLLLLHALRGKFPDDQLDRTPATTLFRELIANLLTDKVAIDAGRERHILVIDGLDEVRQTTGANAILDLIANHFHQLPDWLGVVVTSRPEQEILIRLKNPVEIDTESEENGADLAGFLADGLKAFLPDADDLQTAVDRAVKRSGGIMLYAAELLKAIRIGALDPHRPEDFPVGLEAIYYTNLQRLCPDLAAYRAAVKPLLELVAAAPSPLPDRLAQHVLAWSNDQVIDALKPISSLLIQRGHGRDTTLQLFHKSLGEWLLEPATRHDYQLEKSGCADLAHFLWALFHESNYDFSCRVEHATQLIDWLPLWITRIDISTRADLLIERYLQWAREVPILGSERHISFARHVIGRAVFLDKGWSPDSWLERHMGWLNGQSFPKPGDLHIYGLIRYLCIANNITTTVLSGVRATLEARTISEPYYRFLWISVPATYWTDDKAHALVAIEEGILACVYDGRMGSHLAEAFEMYWSALKEIYGTDSYARRLRLEGFADTVEASREYKSQDVAEFIRGKANS
jgi:hypothetical protein